MSGADRFEKIARGALWLTLALICGAVPVGLAKQAEDGVRRQEVAEAAQRRREAELETEKEKAIGPRRLNLFSMRPFMSALQFSNSTGQLFYTNVSPRAGVICAIAVATNRTNKDTTETLAECQQVAAYASGHMELQFAGKALSDLCSNHDCDLTFREPPDAHE